LLDLTLSIPALRSNKYSNIPAIKKQTISIFANMKYGDRQESAVRKACWYYFLPNSKRAVSIMHNLVPRAMPVRGLGWHHPRSQGLTADTAFAEGPGENQNEK
jgi:hypothetical protein